MINFTKKQVLKSKVEINPFPYFVVKNLLPKSDLKKLNKVLPSFNEIADKESLLQSKSKTKKTILPSSRQYKKVHKNAIFKKTDKLFEKIKPLVIKKFEPYIKKYVNIKYQKSKLNYHSSFSIMRKGYKKSAHLDRRDHLVHILFYTTSDHTKGGDIQIEKLVKNKKVYDIFPNKNDLKVQKKYKVKDNFCLFTLNTPWSYHSASEYMGNKDRKYFYAVYDFPITKLGSIKKNRKKGFNLNSFWKDDVLIKSQTRKKNFFSE